MREKPYVTQKRWRLRHPDRRKAQKNRNYARGGDPVPHGKRVRWSTADTRKIHEWTGTDRELAQILGRSVRAIHVKRAKTTRLALSEQGSLQQA